jgi:peptide/nickel transport system substrate-binding protein
VDVGLCSLRQQGAFFCRVGFKGKRLSKYIRWQALLTLLGIVLVGAVLFYVSWGRQPVVPHLSPTPSGSTVVQARGGAYVEGVAGYPQFINPLFSELNDLDRDLCALIFEGLTAVSERNEIVPLLAHRWEVSEDGLVYTFYLRESVRWQDGEPFTADDVVFTLSVLQSPDFPGLPYLSELWRSVDVEKLDRYTVQFTLHAPYAPFLDYTTIGLLPAHLLEDVPVAELDQHAFNYEPVGTGLFQVEELTQEHVVLSANRYHRLWEQTRLDRLEMRFYPTYGDILAAYEAGEVMGVSRLQTEDVERVRSNPDMQMFSARLSGYSLVFLNMRSPDAPFFQDRRVRQALLYALDRQALIDRVLAGYGLVIHSPILPQSWAYDPEVKQYAYDPRQAKALLERAGWEYSESAEAILGDVGRPEARVRMKKGVPLEFSLLTNDVPDRVALAYAIADQWESVGVHVHVRAVSAAELTQRYLGPRAFDAVLSQWHALPPDPDPYPVWHSTQAEGGGQNYGGFDHRDADEAIEVARQLTDRDKRAELYRQFQEIFSEEVPAILLYQSVYTFCVDKQVRSVQIAPMPDASGRFRNISEWEVLEQEVRLSDLNDQISDTLDKQGYP